MFGGHKTLQNTIINMAGKANGVQTIWTKVLPSGAISNIKNVYFDSFGKIHYD